jgi:hypothetical protein
MKKINRKFIKGTNWALAGLLSFLGFSSCDLTTPDEYGTPHPEYGTPHAEFVVSGKVTDTGGNALKGIRVVVPGVDHHQKATSGFIPGFPVITSEVNDTLYTKDNGSFEYSYIGIPTNDSINIKMKFEDVSENARFETDSTKITFFSSELEGSKGGWFEGTAKKAIQFILKKKDECEDGGCQVAEYGTPYASFRESGRVIEQNITNYSPKKEESE